MDNVSGKQNLTQDEMSTLLTQAAEVSEILKALSHSNRLLILCFLLEGERSVSEIEEFTSIAQATVSQHLTRLRQEKLIASRRDGRQIYYRIVDSKIATLIETLYKLYCAPEQN